MQNHKLNKLNQINLKRKNKMESHLRTLFKTITWRIIATTTTVLTIYFWTKSWTLSLGAGLVANAFKTIFYYIHERIWNLTNYGRKILKSKK